MTRFLIVSLVLLGAIAPLGCQSDPCNERPGLFGRMRLFRQDNDHDTGCCSSCGSSTLGTPVYTEGAVYGPAIPSGIPLPAPSLPGPSGS